VTTDPHEPTFGALPVGSRLSLAEALETQRHGCKLAGSPLYAEVLDAVAADVDAGGVAAELLGPYAQAPFGDAVPLRLLGGVHELVLGGAAPELAAHYPSAGGSPGRGLAAAFLGALAEHRSTVAGALTRGVQTNEPGRSASLLPALVEVARAGLPLRLLEVGASAGLNLWFDRYRYEAEGGAFGPADSPLRFDRPFVGDQPVLGPVPVAGRHGCDRAPIDPTTAAGRLRLRSFVWPDQPERRARLDAALEAVAGERPVVDEADAVPWLDARLADAVPGQVTVVVHTIVLQYLPTADRRRFVALVEAAGDRASAEAPVAWLRMEPGGDQAEIRLTTWPGGTSHLVARSSYHGPPVVLAEGSVPVRDGVG
jgi:hypothetical protein